MFNHFVEVETKFFRLKELASGLAAYEKSGFKKTLETFETTLVRSKGVKQSPSTFTTLNRTLDAAIIQVDSWIKSEQKELSISVQPIEELGAKLLRTRQLLTVKKISDQEAEVEQKQTNDAVENSRTAPDEAASQASIVDTSLQAYGIKAEVQNEADLTLLKGQLGALEVTLLQASRSFRETEESARKNSNRIKNLRGKISTLTPGTPAMEAEMVMLGQIWVEIQPVLESLPESPESPVDFDVNASFYGTAFLDAMKGGQGVAGFYKKAKQVSDSHEVTALKAENLKLKKQQMVVQTENETLTAEKAELIDDLSRERDEGTKLSAEVATLKGSLAAEQAKIESLATENAVLYETNALNQKVAKEINAQRNQAEKDIAELTAEYEAEKRVSEQVFEQNRKMLKQNEDLTTVIDEENRRYLALEAESKAALDAKAKAEESAAFAHKSLDTATTELTVNVKARQTAESDLALRSAQLQRNLEDLKCLNADILELAEFAETLQTDKDKYYTESQYGYIRQKCDALQSRRGELLERVRVAEKSAKQSALEVGYEDSAQRSQIRKLEAEIEQLKEKTLSLQQECSQLKSSDVVLENNQLKAKLKAERDKKFTGVLENLDNAAVKGVIALEKKNQEQKARIEELEAQLAAQSESAPVVQVNESRLAKNIKRLAIGAGFVLAGIATVAALGFLGAVAVTYALPLLAIGLVVAAGGTAIAKLFQSKHEEGIALEVAEHREAQSGFVQKTALAVKATLEKAVITVSSDLEKA